MSRGVLIIGATSAIAQAIARLFAARGDRLYLVARSGDRLNSIAQDLSLRGATAIEKEVMNVNDLQMHEAMLVRAAAALRAIDIVLIAHGTLPDQRECESHVSAIVDVLNTNFLSVVSLLTHIANRLEDQGFGMIVVISSVAGDRGRQSNYVYGSVKGAVSIFLQGLRNRLYAKRVHVLTIKPGFVDTPMTAGHKKNALWATPEAIAPGICRAIDQRRDVLYIPWFWRWIMLVVKAIPESIFKKTRM